MSEVETHFCGGALITSKHILTAAHCLDDVENVKDVEIKIGSNDLEKSKKYSIEAWNTYDDWMFRNYQVPEHLRGNDISIITLSKKVSSSLKPAFISEEVNNKWIGKSAVTAGWGLRENGIRPRFMEKAVLNVSNHIECQNTINELSGNEIYELPLRYLCTNAKPHVVLGCGDSGSPLIVNGNKIIAVNKSSCPRLSDDVTKEQNLHVSVINYIDFIQNITASAIPRFCCGGKCYRN